MTVIATDCAWIWCRSQESSNKLQAIAPAMEIRRRNGNQTDRTNHPKLSPQTHHKKIQFVIFNTLAITMKIAAFLAAVSATSVSAFGGHGSAFLSSRVSSSTSLNVAVGDKIPSIDLHKDFPPDMVNMAEYTKGRKVAVVGLPGAFTPVSRMWMLYEGSWHSFYVEIIPPFIDRRFDENHPSNHQTARFFAIWDLLKP